MTGQTFDVVALADAGWRHPGPAVAAARAGGVGLLDLAWTDDAEQAARTFDKLLAGTAGRVGLRVTAASAALAQRLIATAGDRCLVVLLAAEAARSAEVVGQLADSSQPIWAEIDSADDLEALACVPAAVVARGHECGGWVGGDTSYILLQKLAGAIDAPLYVHGGIGPHTAAAARVAGASGVVLGDQLLLMPESPLPEAVQQALGRLNGSETRLHGELLGMPCRAYAAPSSPALAEAQQLTQAAEAGETEPNGWRPRLQTLVGWGASQLLPIGQDIGLAQRLAARYRSTGRLVQAIQAESAQALSEAARQRHLAPESPLAVSHGTRYPLVQGPMTRVSDSADFARAVSGSGALPFLALALMRGDQVGTLLAETAQKMGDLPWGVGLLGFVPQQLREEQIAEIFKVKPPFALIAGGRPDQAAQFEARGIPTYIHAPAPALLRMYLEQGARRFVFEGRECGGHIGPIASFPLWEQMIEVLLADVPAQEAENVHVLFAGGVHDGLSGAMLAALTAPLAARGMKVGALMGSAYLFTDEIVATGATVAGYREQALACARTVSLETGPGHATRCSDTPFARHFHDRRRALLAEGADPDAVRDELEDLNLGRLRMASKGRARNADGELTDYDAEAQLHDGMFMIGQVATLNRATFTLADLHERVSVGATTRLEDWGRPAAAQTSAAPCDVAIIGIGVLAPGASDAQSYWDNILAGRSSITEVPRSRWDWELYYDPDRSARDKIYSKWGGFIDETVFDPFVYGIPPMSMKVIDPIQLLALESCSRALADAGLADGHFDREHTSVILGASGGLGDLGLQYGVRSELPRFVENPDDAAWDRLPEWGQESFSGSLLNVAAGRVANRLDLGGTNFTVDAACGSSLAAITLATQELESGRSNIVLAGGIDTVNGPFGFLCFSKTQALSPTGTPKTFDRDANGIVISEGAVVCVLKRLADAERDGDRIYATIRAAAGSSDGKALGMTAPRPEGQMRALYRAYAKAGLTPADIDMVEAHGTGTPVGDKAEAETITRVLRDAGAGERSVALGSVKSILGHTKAAAGVAGLVKAALALHHRTLPAHVGVEHPIDAIAAEDAPVYLPREPRPWLTRAGRPRRAAVSAFGFGGTNFHAVLEEYRDEIVAPEVAGSKYWPVELCMLRAADRAALAVEIERLVDALAVELDVDLAELAHGLAAQAAGQAGAPVGLAIVADGLDGLRSDLQAAAAHLADGKPLPPNVRFSETVLASAPRTAFLFPGQGSQYLHMGREPALYLDDFRAAFELADYVLAADIAPALSRIVWPESVYDDAAEKTQKRRLTDTRHAQPALGTLELGYLNLAARLGVQADAAAGHSYGEYAALHAAGVIDASSLLTLSAIRGRAMAEAGASADVVGGMAAVRAAREAIAGRLADFDGVTVANHNAPEETVISGPKAQVEAAVAALADDGVGATVLPVSGAFHTELVAGAQAPLSEAIAATDIQPPRRTVYSNTLGAAYPDTPDEIRALLDRHMLSTVEFVAEIRAMHADGVRLFIELGPKSVVSRMAQATLAGHDDVRTVALDQRGGSLAGLLTGLGELMLAGAAPRLTELFVARGVTACDPKTLAGHRKAEPPKTAWMVSGGCARPVDDPVQRTGKQPALDRAAKTAAIERMADRRPTPAPSAADVPASNAPEAVSAPTQAPAPAAALRQPPAATPDAVAAAPSVSADALSAYHDTMRQFLALQEKVMAQYLGGTSAGAPATMPSAPAAPTRAAPVSEPAARETVSPTPAPVDAPEAVPAAAEAPAFDAKALLVATVAELTGYPHDMIGVDADLEADLGIDSIKRVEILGAFRKQLPDATSQAMQTAMERFTAAKSIAAVLEQLEAIGGTGITAPAAGAESEARTPAPDVDARGLLLATVAELTGYPEDMIGVDADLEADLGIDSIKRVEILGAFRKQLPEAVSEAMQANMERFTTARSVAAVLEELDALGAVASAAAPVEPAVTPAIAHVDRRALLLATVAKLTGYPEDMIGVDADLEADLGIDSIKRVEILGAFRKQLPPATSDAMQADMERFTAAKSVAAVVSEIERLAGAPAVPAETAVVGQASTPVADIDTRALLLATIAELTGYPEDMIGVDADLEADLGIDSIKRVEILGAFRKQLAPATSDAMQADMERFTAARSVTAVLAALESLGTAESVSPQAPSQTAKTVAIAKPAEPQGPLPRFVIRSRAMPLDGDTITPTGLVLLAGPAGESRETLAERLAATGAVPVAIEATEAGAIAAAVAEARALHGAVRGIVSLHGLGSGQADSLAGWQDDGRRCVMTLFHLIQAAGDDIATARVFAASRLGGSLSRETSTDGSPLAGGAGGLLKCLDQEYPEAIARLVDFNGQTPVSVGERLFEEYIHDDPLDECGYTGDARHGGVTVAEPLADTPFAPHIEPAADWVILATGGARGITAGILARLAVPGCTLVLAGRSPEPDAEDPTLAEADDAMALKRVLAEQAKAAGERIKPVELEARARRVLGAREIRANLARLRETGANVAYHTVDVRDEAAFGGLIDALYDRHGRIDAVLHGAGVIEDKLLADKNAESFARVFATKVDSAWILARHLQPDTLKALCFFTSVAGRYGNPGQADYAAANEAVARLAWQLSRDYADTRVMAINWGPWDAGMVTEGVKRQFEARGVTPIPIAAGVDYFVNELAFGSRADVELVAGDGPWAAEQSVRETAQPTNALPLVRSHLRMGGGGALVLEHHLDLEADPYLADHQLDGRPVLPATGAAEWIAQTVAAGWPDWQVAEIRGLRVLGGVVLDPQAGADMTVSARASSHSGAGEQMVDVDIRQAGRKAACYRASVRLVERLDAPPAFDGDVLAGEPLAPAEAYVKYLFHGPRFRLLTAIDAHAETGIDACVAPSVLADWLPGADGHWLLDPGLLDCGPQLAMIWTRLYHDTSALPSAFGTIARYGHEPLPAALRLVFRLAEVGAEGATLRYDVFYVDDDNRVRIALRDVEGTASAALNRLAGT